MQDEKKVSWDLRPCLINFPYPHHCERQSKSTRSTCGYREGSPSFLALQRGSLCHRRCTVRLQKETISIMPYCSLQMHGQPPGLLPYGPACKALPSSRYKMFRWKTFLSLLHVSAAAPEHNRFFFGRLPVQR